MNFIDYCIATKNFSALQAVSDYTKIFTDQRLDKNGNPLIPLSTKYNPLRNKLANDAKFDLAKRGKLKDLKGDGRNLLINRMVESAEKDQDYWFNEDLNSLKDMYNDKSSPTWRRSKRDVEERVKDLEEQRSKMKSINEEKARLQRKLKESPLYNYKFDEM